MTRKSSLTRTSWRAARSSAVYPCSSSASKRVGWTRNLPSGRFISRFSRRLLSVGSTCSEEWCVRVCVCVCVVSSRCYVKAYLKQSICEGVGDWGGGTMQPEVCDGCAIRVFVAVCSFEVPRPHMYTILPFCVVPYLRYAPPSPAHPIRARCR